MRLPVPALILCLSLWSTVPALAAPVLPEPSTRSSHIVKRNIVDRLEKVLGGDHGVLKKSLLVAALLASSLSLEDVILAHKHLKEYQALLKSDRTSESKDTSKSPDAFLEFIKKTYHDPSQKRYLRELLLEVYADDPEGLSKCLNALDETPNMSPAALAQRIKDYTTQPRSEREKKEVKANLEAEYQKRAITEFERDIQLEALDAAPKPANNALAAIQTTGRSQLSNQRKVRSSQDYDD